MATSTTNLSLQGNPDLMRKNLLMAKKLYEEKARRKNYMTLSGRKISSNQLNEVIAMASGLDLPQVTPEFGAIQTSDMEQVARKVYTPQKRTLQFRVSDEAFINDQYGIIKSYGTLLASVFDQAREIAASVYMNGALDTSIISTPQGKPLAATDHPLASGTDSNTFAGVQQTLGPIALEEAINQLMSQKAHKGYAAPKYGPFQLEVAPRNNFLARRIVGAVNQAGGNSNDPNALRDDVTKIVVVPQFTNPEWWCLRSIAEEEQPRFMLQRYAFKVMPIVYDEDVDAWKITAKESYLFDVNDYRGTFYSTPS
ncbi:MAG: hypothetical protein JST35_12345 [Armatimonadetes bacterium]|jgi:hypothetical protein|nr:hypothetical protein [Armatimonadota bacterium]